MKNLLQILSYTGILLLISCSSSSTNKSIDERWENLETSQKLAMRAVHLLHYENDEAIDGLCKDIPVLADMGINTIILEVDYHFTFESHPELRQSANTITKAGAKRLADVCKKQKVRIIPQFQSLGHQSWAENTWKLLEVYPELDLTPGAFPNNEGLYCREWDVTNPRVYEIVFALMDEILEAFDADAMHVGMDEVFLLNSEHSPNTFGKDPAEMYAKCINDIYGHLVKTRGVEMLMWGDRLIDANVINYGEWESAVNGTAAAVDMIPNDIIICDWHYEKFEEYPMEGEEYLSIPMFLKKGFRVLPTTYRYPETTKNFLYYSLKVEDSKMLGHLFTLWSSAKGEKLTSYPPMVEGLKLARPYFK